jgi:hypothetical protein
MGVNMTSKAIYQRGLSESAMEVKSTLAEVRQILAYDEDERQAAPCPASPCEHGLCIRFMLSTLGERL